MRNFRTLVPTIVIMILCSFAIGQDTTETYNLIGGKWTVCTDMEFSIDYQCNKGNTSYEFFKNKTYKEDRQPIYKGKKMPYVPGKWSLEDSTLTIDEDDDKYHKANPKVYNIVWLDSNRFYATGQEGSGGPTVYIYFQRTK